jgi:steroid 5-alpha reductase family enzyme
LALSSTWWLLTLIVPSVLLFLILKVTGIPYTEKRALASRGDDYRAYQKSTSAFIPWFPKSESSS